MMPVPTRGKRRALAVLLAAAAIACASHSKTFDPERPFEDPFFANEHESGDSLDEIWNQPAPSVGSLAAEDADPVLNPDHADPIWGESETAGLGEAGAHVGEKSFSDKAEEAAVATMSILFAAGMTALPYLVGAY
jgi:hypothetical protein